MYIDYAHIYGTVKSSKNFQYFIRRDSRQCDKVTKTRYWKILYSFWYIFWNWDGQSVITIRM